jgi:hypothetical protein
VHLPVCLNIKDRHNIAGCCSQKVSTPRLKPHLCRSSLLDKFNEVQKWEYAKSVRFMKAESNKFRTTLKTRVQEYWLIFHKRISLLSSHEQKMSFFLGWKSRDATCEVWPLYACKEKLGCKSNRKRWVAYLKQTNILNRYYCLRHKRYKLWAPDFMYMLNTKCKY